MVSPVYMNVLNVSNSLRNLGAFQYSFDKIQPFANGNFTTLHFPIPNFSSQELLYDPEAALLASL